MSLEWIYVLVESLIPRLADQGWAEWSRKLDDALRSGPTSGEILRALRERLRELQHPGLGLTKELRDDVEAVLELIRKTGF